MIRRLVQEAITTHTHTHACTHTHTHTLHSAPLGHILTKIELQILTNVLATYSNEKLKEIQLSIQEKQDIRDISREEVEKSLRQRGLTSIADDLKDSIEKGMIALPGVIASCTL